MYLQEPISRSDEETKSGRDDESKNRKIEKIQISRKDSIKSTSPQSFSVETETHKVITSPKSVDQT